MYTTSTISTNTISVNQSDIISYKNFKATSDLKGIFSAPLTYSNDFRFVLFNGKLPYTCITSHNIGYTSPSGVCSVSGEYNASRLGWYMFNYNSLNIWAISSTTGIVYYEFNEPKLIYKYEIDCTGITTTMEPSSWTFDGFDEQTETWITLDTQTAITMTTTDRDMFFTISNPTTKYKKYRLNITANNGYTDTLGIGKFKLYEIYDKLESNKILKFTFGNSNALQLYKFINNNDLNLYKLNSEYIVTFPNTASNVEYIIYAYFDSNGTIKFSFDTIYNIQNRSDIVFLICQVYIDVNGNIDSVSMVFGASETRSFVDIHLVKTSRSSTAVQSECSDVMNDGCIYVIGNPVLNTSYNITTDVWANKLNQTVSRQFPSLNVEQVSMNSCYCFGGSTSVLNTNAYYVDSNTWVAKTNAIVAHQYHTCSVLNNADIFTSYQSSALMYSISGNSWEVRAIRPISTFACGHATCNNIVYTLGSVYAANMNMSHSYDYNVNSWSTKTNMITGKYGIFSRLITNVDIDCFGGQPLTINNIVERYNTVNDSWTSQTNSILVTASYSVGATTTINNRPHTFIFNTSTIERIN